MLTGTPFSQPCGAFHGRTEELSGSLVSQPVRPQRTDAIAKSKIHRADFISGGRVRGADDVALDDFTKIPAMNDIGNAAVFFNRPDDEFCHQPAVPTD